MATACEATAEEALISFSGPNLHCSILPHPSHPLLLRQTSVRLCLLDTSCHDLTRCRICLSSRPVGRAGKSRSRRVEPCLSAAVLRFELREPDTSRRFGWTVSAPQTLPTAGGARGNVHKTHATFKVGRDVCIPSEIDSAPFGQSFENGRKALISDAFRPVRLS
ncbi:unnamed protein product [Protopolystoma xenopodis]|uniref:Uncharacterized protein n=1 Tax=Protopolystoma xenopodis TaxID=117903 RepID=A0A3S4ZIT9_9PLAT|nr:unnamed protein product [Protopolystoma xenopodis]